MTLQKRFRLIGLSILATGLLAALYIYATRPPDNQGYLMGYDIATKSQLGELERIGGKANVLASQFMLWFTSLWQGRQLGETLLVISVISAIVCFLLAHFA